MTDAERIADIAKRAEVATPGPWLTDGAPKWAHVYRGGDDDTRVAEVATHPDAAFIAHAREDVPWLPAKLAERDAEIERLRGLLDQCESAINDIISSRGRCQWRDDTRDEYEPLTDAIRAALEVTRG